MKNSPTRGSALIGPCAPSTIDARGLFATLHLRVMVSLAIDRLGNLQNLFGAVFPAVGALFAPFGDYENLTHWFWESRFVDGLADDVLGEKRLGGVLRGPWHQGLW